MLAVRSTNKGACSDAMANMRKTDEMLETGELMGEKVINIYIIKLRRGNAN